MRARTLVLVFLAGSWVAPLSAQPSDLELPSYTAEQRWQRLASHTAWLQAAFLEFGEEHGLTASEVGTWLGRFYSRGWLGGQEAGPYAIAVNRNHMSWPGATGEVVSSGPGDVQIRLNRPWEAVIGPDRQHGGIGTDAFQAMWRASNEAIADWVGIDVVWREEGGQDLLTFRTEYGPIRASNDLRWARGAFLSWNSFLNLLELQMESGLTAREVGAQAAELYGPGWTSRTPWRLFRGMTWNAMGDPNTDCEVLSASPEQVHARCAIGYTAQRVGQAAAYFDVTLADVLENNRAFAEGVAEQRGMRWEEHWDDDFRTITVTIR